MVHWTKAKSWFHSALHREERPAPQDILVGQLSGMIIIGEGLWILSFFWVRQSRSVWGGKALGMCCGVGRSLYPVLTFSSFVNLNAKSPPCQVFERQCGAVVEGIDSEVRLPRAWHLLALGTWTTSVTSLCLSFLTWKMGIILKLLWD